MSLLRATLTCGVLFAAGIFTFIKALTCEFMGWQLRNQAHSDAEQGTLRYFLNDGGVRNTFNFRRLVKSGGHMSKLKRLLLSLFVVASPSYSADLGIDGITEAAKRSGDLSRQMLHTVLVR